ncbi:NAD-aldehyde dehydrogenase [Irpex rosettiformis]|uniref:NAD-aldehyde dehydrogenase n=1 Tax=Irpex rosettiformis TaxID=378272 RepID=A0ACB8TQZ3_9APHY|nr:NAD-aldehyde dehydrogenase [Irpex rosettiformis]
MTFSTTEQTTIIPHNQQPLVTRVYPTSNKEIDNVIEGAVSAQKLWAKVPLEKRIELGYKFVEEFRKEADDIPLDLTLQMGRPKSQAAGELRGMLDRASYMLSIAQDSLKDISLADTDKPGFKRYIKRVPLGVVFVIAPWNYPYLVTINTFLPALIAGNAVILKPSPQTPLVGERFERVWSRVVEGSGILTGNRSIVRTLHLTPHQTQHAASHPSVSFVSFTGSVLGGRGVEGAVKNRVGFTGVGLELGGKDPAYVRPDADLEYTVGELVDGAFFNSGQSCCAIERIYVHEAVYDPFVEKFVELTKKYKLGDPTLPETNLGPVVSVASADRIRKQVQDAVNAGAKALVPEELFSIAKPGTAYVAPQVLVDVDHTMDVMMEETFGPVVGIQKVSSDDEALKFMNDSPYGLTASVWTNADKNKESEDVFLKFADELETGTVFLNRCDFLDPALAWTGVKNSGRGVSLSKFGYDQLTRAKSVHMKIKTD